MEPNDRKPDGRPSDDSSSLGQIQVLGFAGSLRQGSYNRALIRAAQDLAPDGMRIEHFGLDDIPLYNHDVEKQGDPEPVKAFKRAIDAADAVLIATPEYQHSLPGVLKNALDWASRPARKSPLMRKPAAILGATPGRLGTARAQTELRKVLVYNEMPVLARPSLLMRSAHDKFDDDLDLTDEPSRERLRELLQHFGAWIRFARRWSPPQD